MSTTRMVYELALINDIRSFLYSSSTDILVTGHRYHIPGFAHGRCLNTAAKTQVMMCTVHESLLIITSGSTPSKQALLFNNLTAQ